MCASLVPVNSRHDLVAPGLQVALIQIQAVSLVPALVQSPEGSEEQAGLVERLPHSLLKYQSVAWIYAVTNDRSFANLRAS